MLNDFLIVANSLTMLVCTLSSTFAKEYLLIEGGLLRGSSPGVDIGGCGHLARETNRISWLTPASSGERDA